MNQINPVPNIPEQHQVNIANAADYLLFHIVRALDSSGKEWLEQQLSSFSKEIPKRKFYLAFSSASRKVGKGMLSIRPEDQLEAEEIRKGWQPWTYSMDQACRILFLLHLPDDSEQIFTRWISDIFDTADMREQMALYAGLPLYPFPEAHKKFAAEGVRTNMTSVLEAVALHNPYPADFFDEGAWNQLYLKCCFTDRSLHKIYGIDWRANQELSRIISDYAHERWAAGREVNPAFWRPVVPFVDDRLLEDIDQLFQHKDDLQRKAATLICLQSQSVQAKDMLENYPELKYIIEKESLSWTGLGQEWEKRKPA